MTLEERAIEEIMGAIAGGPPHLLPLLVEQAISKALREARAEGMEEAAKIAEQDMKALKRYSTGWYVAESHATCIRSRAAQVREGK